MKVIGLTGGIGMGKSTSGSLLAQRGVPVVDTDSLARRVVEPGQPALAEIARAFGDGVIDSKGRLRREEVARIIFADDIKRRRLEAIVHPRIRDLWLAQTEQWRAEGIPIGVVVIPLLFEIDAAHYFDVVVCVACSTGSQWQRLVARGWTRDQIEQRLAAQWPVDKKMELANYVVWTEPTMDTHAAQLERILEHLREPAVRSPQ
jgi:dephospho-CoA kinase